MQTRAKQERVIEAVRQGLEGDAAVEFVCQSGYAMTSSAIARNLRIMGGRAKILDQIAEGKSNWEILQTCFPDDAMLRFPPQPPTQIDLFGDHRSRETLAGPPGEMPLYETTKMSVTVPVDLYEALRIAAKAENKTRNEIVVEILTSALSQMPKPMAEESR